MKKITTLAIASALPLLLSAQLTTTFTINTNKERMPISPLIYGTNGQSNDWESNITGRRIGGDRLTTYNWEDNFSNGGSDYINDNDNYLPWNSSLPVAQYLTPNSVLKAFHDTSIAMGCASLITLPAAGYVSRDGNGVVPNSATAPSPRWRKVVNQKGSAFSLNPDTTDGFIYVDECMNNLINKYGNSLSKNGITCYEMDNEWSLWNTADPLMHPAQPTIAEAIKKGVNLSTTIKKMDTAAKVFGPADYGYNSFLNFQSAPDWSSYSSFGNFSYAFLKHMKLASDSVKRRLLDCYDMHWYSEAQGLDSAGNLERVSGGDNDTGVAIARMEAPRTLWDSTYVENSWIGTYYSPCVYILAMQKGINLYYPGTKLGFTEYGYGGNNHISGGIAAADMLGICGRFNIYWCSIWGAVDQYVASAYRIYRNYDGKKSTFGDWHVYARPNNDRTASLYAALQSTDTTKMNIVAMNKDYDSSLVATFKITANTKFTHAEVYAFAVGDTNIKHVGTISSITSNSFKYTIPKLSVYHFVLSGTVTGLNAIDESNNIKIMPNPSSGVFTFILTEDAQQIEIMDVTGKLIKTVLINQNTTTLSLDLSGLQSGVYFARVVSLKGVFVKKLVKE
ncbi:MAG TPA: glycoside hydrolase family 44 protein [Bacteroidia bacterium]|nr:glycoside hydrolase family 44 protein [Bacteroidia bacterium]